MNKLIILVVFLIGSSIGFAQETSVEFGVGMTAPYVYNPHNGVGDTTLNGHVDLRLFRALHLHQGVNYGIMGIHSLRYEVGPELRLMQGNFFTPFANFGGVIQFRPVGNGGMFLHAGVLGDLSRLTNIHFLKIKLETGLDFFFGNITRNEWEMIRCSLVYGF
jgi:hypothetical protein